MFKISQVINRSGLDEARDIMRRIYDENPKHWPNGLTSSHFDGGLYLVRDKQSSTPVGIVGWQQRMEYEPIKYAGCERSLYRRIKVGYYSVGILPEFRNNGFAKEALKKLIAEKSAGVDRVRALIVSSNKPSLALADSLGVEKLVKQAQTLTKALAGIGQGMRAMFRSPVSEGILGPEVRDLARAKGVQLFMPKVWWTAPNEMVNVAGRKFHTHKVMNQLLSPTGLVPKFISEGEKPTAGVLATPTGAHVPAAMRRAVSYVEPSQAYPYRIGEDVDKLREAQTLTGFIPPTDSLGKSMRGIRRWSPGNIAKVRQHLTDKFGPTWIIKSRGGFASLPGSMVTERTKLTPAIMRRLVANPHIAQLRNPLDQVGPMQRWIDERIAKLNPSFFQNINRGTREYRVHTSNGKVIPYATAPRGSVTEYLGSYVKPFVSKRTRQMEEYVQSALDRLPENVRKMNYGFDVGIDHYGRPFIIEANPATGGNASGFLSLPLNADASQAAIKGRLPAFVKLRTGAYLGGLGAGAAALANRPEKPRLEKIRRGFLD